MTSSTRMKAAPCRRLTLLGSCLRARELTDDQRGSIAAFLSVFKGQENGQAKIGLSLHPSIDRAYGLLLPFWKEVTLLWSFAGRAPAAEDLILAMITVHAVSELLHLRLL